MLIFANTCISKSSRELYRFPIPKLTKKDAMSAERKIVFEMDEPGKRFSVEMSTEVQTIYADGIAGLHGGPAVSKISFYITEDVTSLPNGEIKETRVVKLSVAMPTLSLLQGLTSLIAQAGDFGAKLESGLDKTREDTWKEIAKCKEMSNAKNDTK